MFRINGLGLRVRVCFNISVTNRFSVRVGLGFGRVKE